MTIRVTFAGRKLTVTVPKGTEAVDFEVPPFSGNGRDKEKPLIILTDRT